MGPPAPGRRTGAARERAPPRAGKERALSTGESHRHSAHSEQEVAANRVPSDRTGAEPAEAMARRAPATRKVHRDHPAQTRQDHEGAPSALGSGDWYLEEERGAQWG